MVDALGAVEVETRLARLVIPAGSRCQATWKRELPWRDAGPPHHHDDTVDLNQ